ncbi:hypothetical protein [Sporomusa malonica]|uniref:Uncharacterized protein n=1 Tax=Sporomusa malonica TaxID=112901 RepID=A0A1W2BSV1_9FIRM|nr:hypothetical protein [Sporomusa malonica]SMC75959.1 hypothetical protein SAMN04488500_108133 [Sporomusa malonica]
MYCEITYQMTGERWGIFPRDIGEFQARMWDTDGINNSDSNDTIIKKSVSIEIMSCSFTPDKKNKRHKEALEGLIGRLEKAGWEQLPERGVEWYNIRFRKIAPK